MICLLALGVWERAIAGAAAALLIIGIGRLAQSIWERYRRPDSPVAVANATVPYGWLVVALIVAGVVALFVYLLSVDPLAKPR